MSDGASVVLDGEWLKNLLAEIADTDYCYVCREHPSHGHRRGCPIARESESEAGE